MCRSSQFQYHNTLKIKGFFVRLSSSKSQQNSLPDSLTLLFLPRINGAELLVDGSNVRSDSSAFLTLHRVVNVKTKAGEAIFGSRSRVSATGGIRFEVFTRDDKILEGIFRRDEEDEWRLECECGLEREDGGAAAEADVCVAVEGHMAALSERVSMKSKRKRSKRKQRKEGIERLEVIPEENEAAAEDESIGGCCCTCGGDVGTDDGDSGEICGPDCGMMDMDMEGVQWAVDLGLWVMCFGMGYLVSKASARSLRRLRIL